MKGKIDGLQRTGRRQSRDRTRVDSAEQIFKIAENKDQLATVIANVSGAVSVEEEESSIIIRLICVVLNSKSFVSPSKKISYY